MAEPMKFQSQGSSPPTPPQAKYCQDAQELKPHQEHPWEKKPGWWFWCEGILPFDEQPPCQIYISPEKPECGEAAPMKIRISTKLINARIDVCPHHKKAYDNVAALRRAAYPPVRQRRAS